MSVVIGCLTPHPPIIIPEIGRENLERVSTTVSAMETISAEVATARPETLVFISPHSVGFSDSFAVKTTARLEGDFSAFGFPSLSYSAENDLIFVETLISIANALGLDMAKVGRGDDRTDLPGAETLDHGILVPLHYLSQKVSAKIVAVSIDYHDYDEHFKLGKAIRQTADLTGKRVAVIASGDLSHRLIPGAPAGYNPLGAGFDTVIEDIFKRGSFEDLTRIDPELIEAAGECGLRSIYALAGAFDGIDIRTEVFSHEGPYGVGYLVAAVHPTDMPDETSKSTTTQTASAPVKLAMYSLSRFFSEGHAVEPPDDTPDEFLSMQAGTFVCLKMDGELRGCVGTIRATHNNIAEEIMANAIQAATADPRFNPVTSEELSQLSFTVDILGDPERINSRSLLDPKLYGVIVRLGYRTGLLLPDIEGIDTVEEQVAIAKKKAGIQSSEDPELYRFRVIRYE